MRLGTGMLTLKCTGGVKSRKCATIATMRLNSITSVRGSLFIKGNVDLTGISGLPSISSVNGCFVIRDNNVFIYIL